MAYTKADFFLIDDFLVKTSPFLQTTVLIQKHEEAGNKEAFDE